MNQTSTFFLIDALLVAMAFFVPVEKRHGTALNAPGISMDTIWKTTPIVRLNDPAPGGGNFDKFGESYYLESGYFVFWGRHGKSDRKDWSLYSYKNGESKLVFHSFEKFSQPDGISKEFYYLPAAIPNNSSNKILYLSAGSGSMGSWDHVYGFDGEQLKKIVGEGDKIRITVNREVIVNKVRLETVTNDNQAVIFFNSEKPNKIKGWLLHDGSSLKPLFIVDDELPGLPGTTLKGIILNGTFSDKIFIFNDTILANLYIDGAPYRQAIYRFSKNKTELIETSKGFNPTVLLEAAGSDNFIFKDKEIYHYKNNARLSILENKKDLPNNKQFMDYDINSYELTGPEKDWILFTVAGNWPRVFLYRENKISILHEGSKSVSADLFKSVPYSLRTIAGINGIFLKNLFIKAGEDWTPTQYFDVSGKEPKLMSAPELKTTGTRRFDLGDIVGAVNENKILVTHTPFFGVAGFYELTK